MASLNDLLTPEALRKLESLSIRSRYVVEGFRAGLHASPLKGASVEFADHRQYVKGDNLRNLDWKVFGRTERHYIKRFEEETSLRTQIVIDGSASMGYGGNKNGQNKYQYACRLAASLGYIINKQQDAVGLTILTPMFGLISLPAPVPVISDISWNACCNISPEERPTRDAPCMRSPRWSQGAD